MLFIYQSVFRVLSKNKLNILNVFTFAGVISKGRMAITRISNYRIVSRLFRGTFSFGMFGISNRGGGGQRQGTSEGAELTFCRKHRICYLYNRLSCNRVGCRFLHICKMCWRIDQSEEQYHQSDDIGSCPNMTLDYKNSLQNAMNAMNESQVGSDLEHENENAMQSMPGGVYQSSQRGRFTFRSRGRNKTSQPSGRGGSSQSTIERGRNQTSQPSGRGGHSQSIQPLNLSTRGSNLWHPSGTSNQVASTLDLRHPSVTANQVTSPRDMLLHSASSNQVTSPHQYEQPTDESEEYNEDQEIPKSIRKMVDPGVVLSLREENIDLKDKLVATKSDLQDEKYQHQMLQVKFAELEIKYGRLSEENNQLKFQLEKNRQMQRLFPAFMRNSATNQENAYKDKQREENEFNEMRYNDDEGSNFTRGAYGEESTFNLEGSGQPTFNFQGSPQNNFFDDS